MAPALLWLMFLAERPRAPIPPPPPMPPPVVQGHWRPSGPEASLVPVQDRSRLVDVTKYRSPTPHPRLRKVSAALTAKVSVQPVEAVPELVEVLTKGIDDPFERLRVLHDWVAMTLRYDWASFRSNRIPPQEAEEVLRTRLSVCEGYANVMVALCHYAKLECVKVDGYARGISANPFESLSKPNHAWNAVRINGAWYLLDTTWDSRPFRTDYFLLNPQWFVFEHFPTDEAWQLLAPPLTTAQFSRTPWASAGFWA